MQIRIIGVPFYYYQVTIILPFSQIRLHNFLTFVSVWRLFSSFLWIDSTFMRNQSTLFASIEKIGMIFTIIPIVSIT